MRIEGKIGNVDGDLCLITQDKGNYLIHAEEKNRNNIGLMQSDQPINHYAAAEDAPDIHLPKGHDASIVGFVKQGSLNIAGWSVES